MSDPTATTETAAPAGPPNTGTPGKRTRSEVARLAALARWGKYKGKGRQPKGGGRGRTPKPTAAQKEAEKRQAAQDNRAKVMAEFGAFGTDTLPDLEALASGKEPNPDRVDALEMSGIVERLSSGAVVLTAEGRKLYNAASRGDVGAAKEAIDRAEVRGFDRVKKRRAQADKDKAETDKDKPGEEEEKPKGGGGGGGGKDKPGDEDKQRAKDEARRQTAADTAGRTSGSTRIKPAEVDALRRAANGERVAEAEIDHLFELGFIQNGPDGFEASDQGRSALSALERGNMAQYLSAAENARNRLSREDTARTRASEREAAAAERNRQRAEREAQAAARRTPRQRAPRNPLDKGTKAMWELKHGAHDQSTHGRRGGRGRASAGAYRSARAGGATVQEARAAARDVSEVYTARQRIANIDRQLNGEVSEGQRRSLEAERDRLSRDVETRASRTPAAREAASAAAPDPTVRGRAGALHEYDRAASVARARRNETQAQLESARRDLEYAKQREADHAGTSSALRRQAARERAEAQREVSRLEKELAGYERSARQNERAYEQELARPAFRERRAEIYAQRERLGINQPQTADARQVFREYRARQTEAAALRQEAMRAESRAMLAATPSSERSRLQQEAASARDRARQLDLDPRNISDLTAIEAAGYRLGGPRGDRLVANRRAPSTTPRAGFNPAGYGKGIDMDDTASPLLEDALDALADAEALLDSIEPDATKAGRRNAAADQALINAAYEQACALCDLLEALGADMGGEDDEGDEPEMKASPPAELDEADDWLYGSEVKALDGDRVGALAVRFGTADEPDMSHARDYFTKATDYWLDAWDRRPMLYHHALDEATQDAPRIGTWTKATVTDAGIWLEGQLDRGHRYYSAIKELVRRGVLRVSTDSAPHLVLRERQQNGTHEIKRWPLLAASLTPTPAEPRLSAVSFKALLAELGLEGIDSPEATDPYDAEVADATKAATDERARRLTMELDLLALETAT